MTHYDYKAQQTVDVPFWLRGLKALAILAAAQVVMFGLWVLVLKVAWAQ